MAFSFRLMPGLLALALFGVRPDCATALSSRVQGETSASGLVLVAGGGVRCPRPTVGEYDFGVIDMFRANPPGFAFTLQNTGKSPLTIDQVQSSCGCTTALLSGKRTLAPGEQTKVQVTLNPARLKPGKLDKVIVVLLEGNPAPAVSVQLTGQMPELVSFSPKVLDFGRQMAGKAHTFSLTATYDARLLNGQGPVQIVSNNPDVEVRLATGKSPGKVQRDGRSYLCQEVTVTLPAHAALGFVTGYACLAYRSERSKTTVASGAQPLAMQPTDAIGGVFVPITGEVVGSISAMPSIVVFGSVTAAASPSQRVILRGAQSPDLEGLIVTSSTPQLVARLLPSPKASGQSIGQAILEVKLSPKAAAGNLQAAITVRTKKGERLVLPVILNVVPGRSP